MFTATEIQALKPAGKPCKVADADGLFLPVQPSDALLWRFQYKANGVVYGTEISISALVSIRISALRDVVVKNAMPRRHQ